jgi:hypothetical protein
MGILRKSANPDRSARALFGAMCEAAPLSKPEAARTAVFAVLDGLVEAGLATRHQRWANRVELRGIGGEAWLLDDSGVTRVR